VTSENVASDDSVAKSFHSVKVDQSTEHVSQNADEEVFPNLRQLTKAIDQMLHAESTIFSERTEYPNLDGVIQTSHETMTSLLGFNQIEGDWKARSSESTYNVAVLFGKKLVNDQVTVEYASRIRTLARLFKEEKEFRPSLVCFCGGINKVNNVADADAGYVFFRHLCQVQDIDLDGVEFFIENKSLNEGEAILHVTKKIQSKYIPKWLEASPDIKTTAADLYGEGGRVEKKVNVHFSLISSDYHLCVINDVHQRSPQKSVLTVIESMGDTYDDLSYREHYSTENNIRGPYDSDFNDPAFDDYDRYRQSRYHDNLHFDEYSSDIDFTDHTQLNEETFPRGAVVSSWSFQYSNYPHMYGNHDALAFLGKCYLLGEELAPILVNMEGVVNKREFFQKDNFLMLASLRRTLVNIIEELHTPQKRTLRRSLERFGTPTGEINMVSVLESALLSLGRCVDLVKPAGTFVNYVPEEDWCKAAQLLATTMNKIRDFCDPDKPLCPEDWGKLVDDEVA